MMGSRTSRLPIIARRVLLGLVLVAPTACTRRNDRANPESDTTRQDARADCNVRDDRAGDVRPEDVSPLDFAPLDFAQDRRARPDGPAADVSDVSPLDAWDAIADAHRADDQDSGNDAPGADSLDSTGLAEGLSPDVGEPPECDPACDVALEECVLAATGQPVCAAKLVPIPAGKFWMGCNENLDGYCSCPKGNQCPYHEVTTGSYFIDVTEVTAAQYGACIAAGGCAPVADDNCQWGTIDIPSSELFNLDKPGRGRYPMNCVDSFQSQEYCQWRCPGCRLCTEAEWEKAARGGCELYTDCAAESRVWPWGNQFPSACDGKTAVYEGCNCDNGSCEVGSRPAGASLYGVHDLAGNMWEWVDDWYHDSYIGAPADGSAWNDPSTAHRVERGGSFFNSKEVGLRVSYRFAWDYPSASYVNLGFRCCRSMEP